METTTTDTDSITEIQVNAIRNLTKELPVTDFGLPIGIYRLDMLPWHDYIDPAQATSEPQALDRDQPLAAAPVEEAPELLGFVDGEELLDDFGAEPLPYHMTPMPDDIEILATVEEGPQEPQAVHRIAGFPINELEGAFIWLNYDEGFPAFQNGIPFWQRMDFEPQDAYNAFQRYLQMHLGTRGEEEEIGEAATGIRSIVALATDLHSNKDLLGKLDLYTDHFHMYYWGLRAKAYDIFRVAQHRKQQEIRAIETEDFHYITGRKLMHKVLDYMDSDEDFMDMLTPKTAIDLLKTAAQMERVSVGLPANGPAVDAKDGRTRGAQSLEVAFRSIAQETQKTEEVIGVEEGDVTVIQEALKSPEDTAVLQQLIIKISGN